MCSLATKQCCLLFELEALFIFSIDVPCRMTKWIKWKFAINTHNTFFMDVIWWMHETLTKQRLTHANEKKCATFHKQRNDIHMREEKNELKNSHFTIDGKAHWYFRAVCITLDRTNTFSVSQIARWCFGTIFLSNFNKFNLFCGKNMLEIKLSVGWMGRIRCAFSFQRRKEEWMR